MLAMPRMDRMVPAMSASRLGKSSCTMGLPSTSIPMPEGKASRAAVFSEEPTILAAPVRSFWVKQMVTAGMTEAVMATIRAAGI